MKRPLPPQSPSEGPRPRRAVAFAAACLACQSAPSAQSGSTAAPAAGHPAPLRHPSLSLDYVEVTTGGAGADEKLPLVVALHGLGDRPESFVLVFRTFPAKARVVAPHSRTAFSDGFQWFAPLGPMSDEAAPAMGKAADDVAAFTAEAAKAFPTAGKPIVFGFSQGGALGYSVAVRHPEAVAESVPVGGWLPPPLWPSKLPDVAPRVFAFHGSEDSRVPLERDRAGAEALRKLGFEIHFEVVDGVEHAIPPPLRDRVFDVLAKACDEQRAAGRP